VLFPSQCRGEDAEDGHEAAAAGGDSDSDSDGGDAAAASEEEADEEDESSEGGDSGGEDEERQRPAGRRSVRGAPAGAGSLGFRTGSSTGCSAGWTRWSCRYPDCMNLHWQRL